MLDVILAAVVAAATPVPSRLPVVVVAAPQASLRLEVARTGPQREHGLMDRTSLPEHTGMLFVFDQDGPLTFWMKDTLVPLDMVFVGPDGTVRSIAAKVQPAPLSEADATIPLEPGVGKYVIELPAGEAARDGIKPGTRLVIPQPGA
ncbi:MAG TPA: DUF192 domain-containing protein [Candidatus Cybelea sp.]|jgi:hypothetical protein